MTNKPPPRIWLRPCFPFRAENDHYVCDPKYLNGSETAYVRADVAEAEGDEAYEIGKHEGYERAVQAIDTATGGDGEYKGSTIPGETVDSDVMQARIIERCKRADVAEEAMAALKEGRRALGVAVKHAGGDPDTHLVCRLMALTIKKLEAS